MFSITFYFTDLIFTISSFLFTLDLVWFLTMETKVTDLRPSSVIEAFKYMNSPLNTAFTISRKYAGVLFSFS